MKNVRQRDPGPPDSGKGSDEEESSDESSSEPELNEEDLLEEYKNTYWTRVIPTETFEQGIERKHALGPDIFDEL